MGEVEYKFNSGEIVVHSIFYFYGDAASDSLSRQVAGDISFYWNNANGACILEKKEFKVVFNIRGIWANNLTRERVEKNTHPINNYFRIESFSHSDISFVDGVGSNTGYLKLDNLFNHSTTAAHEYGHTLGLSHPELLDIRGQGRPGIMYPRGTLVDAVYQYNPEATAYEPGGTMNPLTRRVFQQDIDNLQLNRLPTGLSGNSALGNLSSVWHEKHLPL